MPAYNANLPIDQANPSLGRRGLGSQRDDLPPPGVRQLDGQISPPYASVRNFVQLPVVEGGKIITITPVTPPSDERSTNMGRTPAAQPAPKKTFNVFDPFGLFSK